MKYWDISYCQVHILLQIWKSNENAKIVAQLFIVFKDARRPNSLNHSCKGIFFMIPQMHLKA